MFHVCVNVHIKREENVLKNKTKNKKPKCCMHVKCFRSDPWVYMFFSPLMIRKGRIVILLTCRHAKGQAGNFILNFR
jgi:hypothetical protein